MASEAAFFLGQFLRSPVTTGAIMPSSRYLAAAVATPIPERGDPVVVELGPGTGPFTAEIQRRLGGRGRHIAVEINPRLARPWRSGIRRSSSWWTTRRGCRTCSPSAGFRPRT